MRFWTRSFKNSFYAVLHIAALCISSHVMAFTGSQDVRIDAYDAVPAPALGAILNVGDVVFIRVPAKPFREVAIATGSWTNHVGIVVDTAGDEPLIAESAFPFSRKTPLSRFAARSDHGRIAVARLKTPLTPEQQKRVAAAADRRLGIFYDTGFDLHSRRQFCSRYVREVLDEATGVAVGETETFATLFAHRPGADLGFWKVWYFGSIPWERRTVTPASVLRSPELRLVFDGVAMSEAARQPGSPKPFGMTHRLVE